MTYIKSLSFPEKIKKNRIYKINGTSFKYIHEIWLSDIKETKYFITVHEMDNKLFILKDNLRLTIFDLDSHHIIYNDETYESNLFVMKYGIYKP